MVEHSLDTANSILYVRPKSALDKGDFDQLAKTVDPYIEKTGDLAGVIVEAPAFPGWESLGAMVAHFRFVRDHHKRVKRIALVTDSALGMWQSASRPTSCQPRSGIFLPVTSTPPNDGL